MCTALSEPSGCQTGTGASPHRETRFGATAEGKDNMRKRWANPLGVLALGLAVAGGITSPDRAQASHVSCGDTITADTTLDSDLLDCPNIGILIGADNITLDLNGHTIDGIGPSQNPSHLAIGVSLTDDNLINHEGITVKNGSIRDFEVGLHAVDTRDTRLLGLAMSEHHGFGIVVGAAARILIQDCSFDHNGDKGAGLLLTQSSGPGIEHDGPVRHARVVDSSFQHNGDGIRSFGTKDSVIKRNLLSDNEKAGIDWNGKRSRLSRNDVIQNGNGIRVGGGDNTIAHNNVSDSRHVGVGIGAVRGNLLARNVITEGTTNIRISGELEPGRGGAVNTVIRHNRLRRADRDGVLVQDTAEHTLLRYNSARDAQGDGFDVEDRHTKVGRNLAVSNHDLGIEAVRGARDGGGNVARHNGDPRQCTQIVCR